MIYTRVEVVAAAANKLEPPLKKRKTDQPPPSFLSLPDVLILNCLSRVSKSYYPKLSLVSKTFRSLILSLDLNHARFHHKTQESFFHVCLELPGRLIPSWYTLWIKPEDKKKTTLVQVPSSYAVNEALFIVHVGLDVYAFRQSHPPSRTVLVRNKDCCLWRLAPNMIVARANPIACVLNEKIYVMGGLTADESGSWGEVFNTKTQTWEPLPDPPQELRFSSVIRKISLIKEIFFIRSNDIKDSVYNPKLGKWVAAAKTTIVGDSRCSVNNVLYSFRPKSCLWYDTECNNWIPVKGLSSLHRSARTGLIETFNYNGKLLILWDKPTKPRHRICEDRNIFCALIAFEKRKNGHVWGKVERSSVVLTVPSSYRFLRYTVIRN
ncbi:hypothetical protein CARUB_v10007039mg [Capsella rubella]|uniref:F-box domain-containing protein n=1 Tax=Capsella rubella TaxID=81985 RepID=R0H4R3_9BRAS|nr:hypothetical protein CARUB_v10007039mg [Capsella rubella]